MSTTTDDLPDHWPLAGDRLFVQSDWAVDARIATSHGERLYRMKRAFKTAADMLVTQTEEHANERRDLVWPVVFCYRQYIELALKDMIAAYGAEVVPKIVPNWSDHGLLLLWRSYRRLIAETLSQNTIDDLPEVAAVEACIEEFDRIDPGSYTFRYPTDRNGKQATLLVDSLDLLHLRNVMEGLYLFLDAAESVLDAHFGTTAEEDSHGTDL